MAKVKVFIHIAFAPYSRVRVRIRMGEESRSTYLLGPVMGVCHTFATLYKVLHLQMKHHIPLLIARGINGLDHIGL